MTSKKVGGTIVTHAPRFLSFFFFPAGFRQKHAAKISYIAKKEREREKKRGDGGGGNVTFLRNVIDI
jgi:hypothetical protein